jgi:hypothetical protein
VEVVVEGEGKTGGNLYTRPCKTFLISNFSFYLHLLLFLWKSEAIRKGDRGADLSGVNS